MITRNMVRFMTAFESKMAHESVDEVIAEMCAKSSETISNAFDYEI